MNKRNGKPHITPEKAYAEMRTQYKLDFLPLQLYSLPATVRSDLTLFKNAEHSLESFSRHVDTAVTNIVQGYLYSAFKPKLNDADEISYASMIIRNPELAREVLALIRRAESLNLGILRSMKEHAKTSPEIDKVKLVYEFLTKELLQFVSNVQIYKSKLVERSSADDWKPAGTA